MLLDVDKCKIQRYFQRSLQVFEFSALWANYLAPERRQNIKSVDAGLPKSCCWKAYGGVASRGWSGQLNKPGSEPQTRMSCLTTHHPCYHHHPSFAAASAPSAHERFSFSCFQVQTSHSSLSNTCTSFHVFSKHDQRGRLTRRFRDFCVTLLTVSVKRPLEHFFFFFFLPDPIHSFYISNFACSVNTVLVETAE